MSKMADRDGPGGTEGRAGDGFLLEFRRVWGVVRGQGIHGAVRDSGPEGFDIREASKRRIHLSVRPALRHSFIAQSEMVRRDFTGDADPASLCRADHLQAATGRQVRDVQVGPRRFRQI